MSARGERGTVTIFTVLSLAFLLAMGGFAIDLVHLTAVRAELQRSMDAAALAGAGNLGFGDYAFAAARAAAHEYAGLSANGYRGGANGTIDLLGPGGSIDVGTWMPWPSPDGTFTPSASGSVVNAIRARYATTIPASFLRILGFTTLEVSAEAIAVSSPPMKPASGSCILPVGVSKCAFRRDPSDRNPLYPETDFNSSKGCGRLVAFHASGNVSGTPLEAAWVNLHGTGAPVAATLTSDVTNSAGTGCNFDPFPLVVDSPTDPQPGFGASGGSFIGPAAAIRDQLRSHRESGITIVTSDSGETVVTGWKVTVPVIDFPDPYQNCPEPVRPWTGTPKIVGWTKLVLTAFDFQGSSDPTVSVLPLPPGISPTLGRRTAYGYISCERDREPFTYTPHYNSNPASPAVISALSRRLHLVK